jgi:hypothetical protein
MHTVVVGVKEGFEDANYNVRFGSQDIVVSALWCDECLGSFGAKRLSRSAPGEPELRTPTIEDIVRDVVEQALVDKGLI